MKKPQLTIRMRLLVIVGILNILIALLIAHRVYSSWLNYKQAQQLKLASAIIDNFYNTNKNLSLERASSQAILYAIPDADSNLAADLIKIRQSTDQELNSALQQLDIIQHNVPLDILDIKREYQTLLVQRAAIDSILKTPATQRNFNSSNQFFQTSSSLINRIQHFILTYSSHYQNSDPIINQQMVFKHFVWELAENTGKGYAIIGQMIAENKAPSPEQRKQLSSLNSHIEYGWELLRTLSSNNELAKKLNPYIEEANTHYFFIYEQINELFNEDLAEGLTIYPISIDMWLGLSAQAVDSLLLLQDEILKETQAQANQIESVAQRRIIISLFIFLCALVISIYCWHIIVFRVTKPINNMINTLYTASHQQEMEDPELYAPDEIVKLSRVLQAFERNTHKLRQSNEELERFAFIAAHDLKTPLRAVDTISEWLEEDLQESLPEKSKAHFAELRNRIRLMDKLLDDTLEYARIDAKIKNKPSPIIKGADLVAEIATLIKPPSGFTITSGEQLRKAPLSKFPLQQVLYNLVHNAVIHHHRDKGQINVDLDESGSLYIFSVRDDGPGIDEKYHHKIFEMFQTLQPREKSKGRGMGLAIARKIISAYGGSINLQSAPGHGCHFYFTWPKATLDETGAHPPDSRREYA